MDVVELARFACFAFAGWHLGGAIARAKHLEPTRDAALLSAFGFTLAVALTVFA